MKVYQAVFNEEEMEGVYALSVVYDPAMQDHWVMLNEHKMELATVDEKKGLLLGAALIPDKKILRTDSEGNEFWITFSSETIEKLWHSFFKNQKNNNSSLEHDVQLDGMSVVEGWIVQDPKNDKSNVYGKEYPKGTAVAMMKATPEVLELAKEGKIKGFSIDALLGLEKLNFKNEDNMSKQDFIDAFKAVFTAEPKAEEIEVKAEAVTEVTEAKEEPQIDLEGIKNTLTEVLTQFSQSVDKKIDDLKVEFSTTVSEKDKVIEDLKVELSGKPEVEPIAAQPKAKEAQVLQHAKDRKMTTKDRVMSTIFNLN